LISELTWLRETSPAAVARACREVIAAGWSAQEILAWVRLHDTPTPVRNPVGFLRHRLRNALDCWRTAAERQSGVRRAQQNPSGERPEDLGPLDHLPTPPPHVAREIRTALDRSSRARKADGRSPTTADSGYVELPAEVSEQELAAARREPDWAEATSAFAALRLHEMQG
jgi:hypothetical protein